MRFPAAAACMALFASTADAFVAPAVPATQAEVSSGTRRCSTALRGSSASAGDGGLAIIICDHGSRRAAANDMINEVAARFRQQAEASEAAAAAACVIEVAHMELAEPTIEQAFDKCVAAGAKAVVLHPFFLSPGRHVSSDIPELLAAAASRHPGVKWKVSEPLGLAPLMPQLMNDAVAAALQEPEWQGGQAVAAAEGQPSVAAS